MGHHVETLQFLSKNNIKVWLDNANIDPSAFAALSPHLDSFVADLARSVANKTCEHLAASAIYEGPTFKALERFIIPRSAFIKVLELYGVK